MSDQRFERRMGIAVWLARLGAALRHRRTRAIGHLLSGTAATLVITLVSVALAARALGPAQYGVLALMLALGQSVERLASFQSWQPLIRYGATLDFARDREALGSLFKFGLVLDLIGSAAAWAIASLLAIAAHIVLGIGWPVTVLTLGFLTSLLFNFNGTSTAVFRLSDRFRAGAQLQVAAALIRLTASAAAFWMGAGVAGFVLVWGATQVIAALMNLSVALAILRRLGIGPVLRAPLAGVRARFPGLWAFTWSANLSLTMWASAQQLDTLIVGWLADPASAGLFHLAKRVSRVVQQVGSHVEAVVYPDLGRQWAAGKRGAFIRLIVHVELLLAGFGASCLLAAVLLASWAMRVTAGPDFAAAGPLLTVQILAVTFTISGAASRAGLLAIGRQSAVLRTVMAAAATFYVSVAPLVLGIGAMGANIAHVLFGVAWLGGLTLSLRAALPAERDAPAGAASPDGAVQRFDPPAAATAT